MLHKLIHGLIIGLLSALFACALWSAGYLDWLESASWDFRVRHMAKAGKATDDIRLIYLDQTSLDFAKKNFSQKWPWDREVYSYIVNFCKRAGAKAIVFDVLFTEPSKTSVEDDLKLGISIATNRHFVSAMFLSNEQGESTNWPAAFPPLKIQISGLGEYRNTPQGKRLTCSKASFSIPEISTNSAMIGDVTGIADTDGKVRRISPFHFFDDKFVPSLGLAAFLAGNPDAKLTLKANALEADKQVIPLDSHGRAILNFRGSDRIYKPVNATSVLNSELRIQEGSKPEIDPSFFHDKYVFFGFTAPALVDIKATPVSKIYPGTAVLATMLDNLLSNDFIQKSASSTVILLVIGFSLIAGIVGRLCLNGTQSSLTFIILLPLPMLMGFAAYSKGIWLSVSPQELAIIIALVSAAILNYATEGKQKRFLKTAFKQYISGEVIEKLVKNPGNLKLGGETRELSIFFSDVAGFTGISELLNPEQLTALLNEYLTAMTDIIYSEGGTIDKYEGDAIIAFWNAPLDLPNHQEHAVRAAIRCNNKLNEMRPDLKEKYGKDLFARIGINSGPVVVGNMGSIQRFNYTFLGDAGNLASRLEGQNKTFSTSIMISEFTFKKLGTELAAREISTIRVVGKKVPIKVYEPMFKVEFAARADLFRDYDKALQLYYKGQLKEALEIFTTLSDIDPPSAAYAKRCKDLIEKPPQTWDGVWSMTEK